MRAPRRRRRRGQAGFTLVELMISLLLFSFVVAGVLAIAVAMATSYREQRVTIATETAARGALSFMSDALRGANPGARTGTLANLTNCGAPVMLDVDNEATGPDTLRMVFAYGGVVGALRTAYSTGDTVELIEDDDETFEAFEDRDWIVITDGTTASLLRVTEGDTGATLGVDGNCDPAQPYPAGSLVIRAMYAQFYVAALDGVPTLFLDPNPEVDDDDVEPIAEGVEDLQIALGYDATTDGLTETANGVGDEWAYNASGELHPLAGTLRAVRVSLVARSLTQVSGAASGGVPALEDRPAGTADRYRRRVLSSTIELRNMEGSP